MGARTRTRVAVFALLAAVLGPCSAALQPGGEAAPGRPQRAVRTPQRALLAPSSKCDPVVVDDKLAKLPKNAAKGAPCGAGIAVCAKGLCCGQNGRCDDSPVACDGTCHCAYSGRKSACAGKFPVRPPAPAKLPKASPDGACGPYAAKCPGKQCCSVFGICTANEFFCSTSACLLAASPGSKACKAAHRKYPRGRDPVTYEITATTGPYSPDGSLTRDLILINGQWGSALLQAEVGQRVIVVFKNAMLPAGGGGNNSAASIHWHGMLQMNTNQQDGVVLATQRPVLPGESFVYSFVPDAAGSYWWHSHYKAQYLDGLKGQLIVRDPSRPINATQAVVVVSDLYSAAWSDLMAEYLSPAAGGDEPTPRNGVLNGISQDDCLTSNWTQCKFAFVKGSVGTCDSPKTHLTIVNSGGFAVFDVSVQDHLLMVVALDAVPVERAVVGAVRLNNGQRVDAYICRTDNSLNSSPVWIKAMMPDDTFPQASRYNMTLGVLYYSQDPPPVGQLPPPPAPDAAGLENELPGGGGPPPGPAAITLDDARIAGLNVVNPSAMEVLHGDGPPLRPPPANVTIKRTIDFTVPPSGDGTQYAYFDQVSFKDAGEGPSLLERIYGNPEGVPVPATPTGPDPQQGWNVVSITAPGTVVELVFNNRDDGEHPLHLHGHWFWVMARGAAGAGDYAGQPYNLGALARDTETIEATSYIILRFVANNPGVWMFHLQSLARALWSEAPLPLFNRNHFNDQGMFTPRTAANASYTGLATPAWQWASLPHCLITAPQLPGSMIPVR